MLKYIKVPFGVSSTSNFSREIFSIDPSCFLDFDTVNYPKLIFNVCDIVYMPRCNIIDLPSSCSSSFNPIIPISNQSIEELLIEPDDKFVEYTILLDCKALSSDKEQRKKIENKGVEVHGSIWILINNYVNGLLSKIDVISIYKKMKKVGNRLPSTELLINYINKINK